MPGHAHSTVPRSWRNGQSIPRRQSIAKPEPRGFPAVVDDPLNKCLLNPGRAGQDGCQSGCKVTLFRGDYRT
jgi:hypothetical protein